jgi:hypothetical protein
LAGTSGIIDPGVSSMKLASWVVVTGVMVVVAHAHAEPRLRVAGAKDGIISLTLRDGLVLSRTVRVVADNSEPATGVVVAISSFEEPGGGQATVEPVRRTFESVTLDAPAVLDLKATFPRPGRYTAELDVIRRSSASPSPTSMRGSCRQRSTAGASGTI